MGTRFSLVLPGIDAVVGESLAAGAEDEVRSHERLMSRYDPHSPVSEINRAPEGISVRPPRALWDILDCCSGHQRRTEGYFDVTQGAIVDLWRRSPDGPAAADLAQARSASGSSGLFLDPNSRSVVVRRQGLQLDLGAVGKGIALDAVTTELRRRGVRCAFLSFGESSIATIGCHPSGQPWPVGVADLFDPSRALHCFPLSDRSLSTSGNRVGQATSHGHTVRPADGVPITGYRTLSVAASSALESEVISTALLAAPEDARSRIAAAYPGASAIEFSYEQTHSGWIGRMTWRHDS